MKKSDIRAKLGKVLKVKDECITIYGMKAAFGGGRTSAFALVYDSLDDKKKYDSKCALKRVSQTFKLFISPSAASGAPKSLVCRVCVGLACLRINQVYQRNNNYFNGKLGLVRSLLTLVLTHFRINLWALSPPSARQRRKSRAARRESRVLPRRR